LSDFKSYIDFKKANPYAEKDVDFEREQTPWLKKRSSYTIISNNKLLNQDSSKATLKNPVRTSKNFDSERNNHESSFQSTAQAETSLNSRPVVYSNLLNPT